MKAVQGVCRTLESSCVLLFIHETRLFTSRSRLERDKDLNAEELSKNGQLNRGTWSVFSVSPLHGLTQLPHSTTLISTHNEGVVRKTWGRDSECPERHAQVVSKSLMQSR
jgi:hypothetical protein